MQLLYADYSTALRTYCLWAHEVLCWGHTFLQANNCMWLRLTSSDEDAPMRYIASHQTQWQSQWKTPRGREQCHMNGYTLGHLRGQGKWPTGAPIWLPLEFCSFVKRLFYRKTHYKSSNCSAEATRRSSWPICYCLEKSNWTHTQTHTITITLWRMHTKG